MQPLIIILHWVGFAPLTCGMAFVEQQHDVTITTEQVPAILDAVYSQTE